MTKLRDTFYLKRASRYPDPLNGNERLPVVYGDLSDGDNGIWTLPRIDDIVGVPNTPVYCFAAHETLSVANGNSVTIYEDGMELNPVLYAFNQANNYGGLGVISTIIFTSPKDNAVITAKGKGKPTTAGGATLMESIIDIVDDFLTVENDFTSALYEATSKSLASQVFTAQAYKAAGVIIQDGVIWDIITEMMASFLGSAYLNGDGKLVLSIDDGAISQYGNAGIISKSDSELTEARQRLANIINQCPCNYAYNYVTGGFRSETDDTAHADIISQNIYGVRKPNTPYQFYWCRDLTTVQAVQDIIVNKFKDPIYEVGIEDKTLKRIIVDRGDLIVYSAESLYDKNGGQMVNQYWIVISVKPDFAKAKINFRALQTVYFLTVAFLADGTYIADGSILAGGKRDLTVY